jgi:hypothetical protein
MRGCAGLDVQQLDTAAPYLLSFLLRPRSRENPGPLNFRARCVSTCQSHRPRRTPVKLAMAFDRMLPSALCQGVLKLGIFRGSIAWPVVPPVYASFMALRPCPQDSEPVWLATLYVGTFKRGVFKSTNGGESWHPTGSVEQAEAATHSKP